MKFDGPKDLPAQSIVEIRFQDVSLMDTATKVLGSINITGIQSFPISFSVRYNPSDIRSGHRYSLSARIIGPDGKLHYINDMHISVDLSKSAEPTIDIPVIKSKRNLREFESNIISTSISSRWKSN